MPMFPLYKSQDRLTFFFSYYYRRHFTKIRYLPLVNFTPQMSKNDQNSNEKYHPNKTANRSFSQAVKEPSE